MIYTIDNAFDCVPFYRAYVEYTYVKKMQSVDEDNAEVQTWGKPLLFPNEDINHISSWNGIWNIIRPQIIDKIGKDIAPAPEIAYINLFQHGDNSFIHTDREDWTVICYLNEHWNYNWGGETFFYKDDEVIHCQLPKGGSLVIFEGKIEHRAGLVSSNAPFPRMGLTYMFNEV